jgi:hypothetical protein
MGVIVSRSGIMRCRTLALAGLLVATAATLAAQERVARDTTLVRRGLPPDVQRDAIALFNASALRARGRTEVDSGRTITGDVAVLDGPVIVAGRITGRVTAINADVIVRSTGRIDGDLVVVGGEAEGLRSGAIGGETRLYRDRLYYVDEGDRLAMRTDEEEDERDDLDWWRRFERRLTTRRNRIHIASAGAYNRVEGLPVNIGPVIRHNIGDARLLLDAFVVMRTETSFRSDSSDIGYNARLELRPRRRGVAVGGRLFEVNSSTEAWQLSDLEAGLASFLTRRDYRDYYGRHGGAGYISLVDRYWGELSLSYGHERWGPRADADPWSLFRAGSAWRPNPLLDEGRMHLVTLSGRLDTRNDRVDPKDGWLVLLDVERGSGQITQFGPTSPGVRPSVLLSDGGFPIWYARGFVDIRRYTRLSPHGQLDIRGVFGGWLGGDELPLQRRLSVDGPGAMPGFGFRRTRALEAGVCATDVASAAGLPAQCERIALMQVEARGDIRFAVSVFGLRFDRYPEWVGFADVGRGWLVRNDGGNAGYASNAFPPLSTFRADIGGGLHFGPVGVYLVKAVSHDEPPLALIRLRRRF